MKALGKYERFWIVVSSFLLVLFIIADSFGDQNSWYIRQSIGWGGTGLYFVAYFLHNFRLLTLRSFVMANTVAALLVGCIVFVDGQWQAVTIQVVWFSIGTSGLLFSFDGPPTGDSDSLSSTLDRINLIRLFGYRLYLERI